MTNNPSHERATPATGARSTQRDGMDAVDVNSVGESRGDWIGPYKLLEKIGEGGFGVVWLAERREPMVQRVAIKVIKPGMDSRAVLARFEQERQALAVMDHPNVARVLDGGLTPAGRPFFVMEHVKGEPITQFCDRNRLTIKQRLELFIPVCEAVQHAHMKGIIHRDIKPSNILVSYSGSAASAELPVVRAAVIKVIDFGVAKAISHALTDKTIFTEHGQIIGTPEYMSPEQAEMGATDIDTRTDVYSLGVVLYELLVGALPFDSQTLRSIGYAEIQRVIREVEPPRPSTKLSAASDENAIAIAKARQTDREAITGELRRELEWIPLKAIRKDRSRRYEGAAELSKDIARYLEQLPIEAAPESRLYQFRKVVQRWRVPLAFIALIGASVCCGMIATVFYAQRAQAAAKVAMERAISMQLLAGSQLQTVAERYRSLLFEYSETQEGQRIRHVRDNSIRDRLFEAVEIYDAIGGSFTPDDFVLWLTSTTDRVALLIELVHVSALMEDMSRLEDLIREHERMDSAAYDIFVAFGPDADKIRVLREDFREMGIDPQGDKSAAGDLSRIAVRKLEQEIRPANLSEEQFTSLMNVLRLDE